MTFGTNDLDWQCINTLRGLAVDAIENANSGHPGLPCGAAPMAYVLWARHLRHNPKDPAWPNRDRFVLSAGHGSAMLYSLLYLTGYDVSLEDIRRFRQWGSCTPGHPEYGSTPGVEATTGPLGQGLANAVGMAIAERFMAELFNRPGYEVVNHYTYAILGDGCIMEGIAAEASSLAGHLKLGKLICLYDANDVTLDGPLSLAFSEDVGARYRAYGWQVLTVEDGDHDLDAIDAAITQSKRDQDHPSLIIVKTTIGFGAPTKQGSCKAHGSPLGREEVEQAKRVWSVPPDTTFHVPAEVLSHWRNAQHRGAEMQEKWRQLMVAWRKEWPELAKQWDLAIAGRLPDGWDGPVGSFEEGSSMATRVSGGNVLNVLSSRVPWLVGGDADVSSSTKTAILDGKEFRPGAAGRNIHFGVREHAMAGIANGMAYHGGVRPYVSTFLVFADYMRPSIRLAAMSRLPVIYVFTHDSVAVGEDGPTHQPVEQLASLRCVPNLVVLRPADANETVEAWKLALARTDGPTALMLTRQAVPTMAETSVRGPAGVRRGAYVLKDTVQKLSAIIIATGSEVHLALKASEILEKEGIGVRVVSMPSWELFSAQPEEYRETVLPPTITARLAVEAATPFGWERWLGNSGECLGVERFGASAPAKVVMEKLGFTPENIAAKIRKLVGMPDSNSN